MPTVSLASWTLLTSTTETVHSLHSVSGCSSLSFAFFAHDESSLLFFVFAPGDSSLSLTCFLTRLVIFLPFVFAHGNSLHSKIKSLPFISVSWWDSLLSLIVLFADHGISSISSDPLLPSQFKILVSLMLQVFGGSGREEPGENDPLPDNLCTPLVFIVYIILLFYFDLRISFYCFYLFFSGGDSRAVAVLCLLLQSQCLR